MPRQNFFNLFPVFYFVLFCLHSWTFASLKNFSVLAFHHDLRWTETSKYPQLCYAETILNLNSPEVCHGQISGKPEYSLLEALHRNKQIRCWRYSPKGIHHARVVEPTQLCGMNQLLQLQWERGLITTVQHHSAWSDLSSLLLYRPTKLSLDGGAWPFPHSTHWAASGLAVLVEVPSPCSGV